MSSPPQHDQPRRPAPGVIERLYTYWIASSLVLLLLIIMLTLFVSGVLRSQLENLADLDQRLAAVEQSLASREAPQVAAGPGTPVTARPDDEGETAPAAIASAPAVSDSAENALDDAALSALLGEVLVAGDDLPFVLADPDAAETVLQQIQDAPSAEWSGESWARAAVLARLLDCYDIAEFYAGRAAAAGVPPRAYDELCTRLALLEGRAAEALTFAERLHEQTASSPVARLLLAQAYAMQEDYAAADETLGPIGELESLSQRDLLRLANLLVVLERWPALETVLDTLGPLPDELIPERDYLRAVWLIQQDRCAEALAVLDYLLELRPGDYDVRTWRGVALLEAGQYEAARAALAHAEQNPGRPEAWYWLGVLEIRTGNPEAAISYLQRTFTASARYAPAWEALGTLALNRGDLAVAQENLVNALDINPRRASAHLLLAIVHAKAGRQEEAAQALRDAFLLDGRLLETAKQTEVLTRMFGEDGLEALAPPPEQPPPEEEQATPSDNRLPEQP